MSAKTVMLKFGLWAVTHIAQAGPSYVTDDPEPVEHKHWEFYLASQLAHDSSGWSGTSPHVEINFGAIPNLQLHLIAPVAFNAPADGSRQFGPSPEAED